MTRDRALPETCRVLAAQLASECVVENIDQVQWMLAVPKTNTRSLVIVATADRAIEQLLDFMKQLRADGVIESTRTWPDLEDLT